MDHPHNADSAPTADAPPLRLLFWESTVACNLECVHCRRLEVSQQLSREDMNTQQAEDMIRSLPQTGKPIMVFSGGEPLMRPDLFHLAEVTESLGLPMALATNGTTVTEPIAKRIVDVGFRRVSMSFDGADAPTHDAFRGMGAFDRTVQGFRDLRKLGMSMQINTTIAKHNYRQLDEIYDLALDLGADALHMFMLVPVGCGMELDESVKLNPVEYEDALNWIYDRSLEGKLHLKATCAPHYFRIMRERAVKEGRPVPVSPHGPQHGPRKQQVDSHPQAAGHPHGGHPHGQGGHPGGHPGGDAGMSAMSKGCLAGSAVCFVSHKGEVFPCGYLPVTSGNVKDKPLPEIWRDSKVFAEMRDDSHLEGKCGLCEYKKVCMGCRARAFADAGNYLAEEPNCDYVPLRVRRAEPSHN